MITLEIFLINTEGISIENICVKNVDIRATVSTQSTCVKGKFVQSTCTRNTYARSASIIKNPEINL